MVQRFLCRITSQVIIHNISYSSPRQKSHKERVHSYCDLGHWPVTALVWCTLNQSEMMNTALHSNGLVDHGGANETFNSWLIQVCRWQHLHIHPLNKKLTHGD